MTEKTTKTFEIWRYLYTLEINGLIAKLSRPAKNRLGVANVFYLRFQSQEEMDKYIIGKIQQLKAREEQIKENRRRPRRRTPAQAIKQELVKEFKDVKFSCTYETYAGGDAVRIWWTNWPTEEQVDRIARKYQAGNFDGMRDIYEYNNTNPDLPQAKYVTMSRKIDNEIIEKFEEFVDKRFGKDEDLDRHTIQHKKRAVNNLRRNSELYQMPSGIELQGQEYVAIF